MFGKDEPDAAEQEALAADQGLFAQRLFAATPKAWVTRAIVVANIVIFLAMLADGAGLFEANSAVHLRWGANFGPMTKKRVSGGACSPARSCISASCTSP